MNTPPEKNTPGNTPTPQDWRLDTLRPLLKKFQQTLVQPEVGGPEPTAQKFRPAPVVTQEACKKES